MATEVSLRDIDTGIPVFYSTYSAARSAAGAGDVISIYANLTEQITLLDGVDVYLDPGTELNHSGDGTTITDNNVTCKCNITGGGIIKNSYSGSTKRECIKISNSSSEVNIECYKIDGLGENNSTLEGSSVDVSAAAKFRLICNKVYNKYNTAIRISGCDDIFLNIRTVESGTAASPNADSPVLSLERTGSVYINELLCTGYGSCLDHKDGVIGATINKLLTLLPAGETPSTTAPTLLLDAGTGDQDLVLYFDEIKNFNSTGGDTVKIDEGKASLIGRSIYCTNGKSLDLTHPIVSAYIQCDEIISLTEGINIANRNEPIVIEANYIEGSSGNGGVIKSVSLSNYVLRNAKIKNTTTSSPSIGIYIVDGDINDQNIEIENLIIVTGIAENQDYSIYRDGENNINIKNLLLFVRAGISDNITLLIGDINNFKYIEDSTIQ
ncbi:MAG: hypothetical protein KDD00_02435 [Ignavibacteriae bacterium]|nr:hypothetical protein [Ignavibacteriota bacterium]